MRGWKVRTLLCFVTINQTHLFLGFEVGVVLGHVLRRPLLDQTAAQQPDSQTGHEHADVGDEHADAVARICTDHAGDKQRKPR